MDLIRQIFSAIFQGIVQGITEFLPVSSSGHLSVVQHYTTTGEDLFLSIMLHIGTLIAVFIAFRKALAVYIKEGFLLVGDVCTGKFKWKEMTDERRFVVMIFVALIPLLLIFPFRDAISGFSTDGNMFVEGVCFLFTGGLLILASRSAIEKSENKHITLEVALLIGLFQSIATLPGVSRSGATVGMALILGLSKTTSMEFSFLLGVPAIIGAALSESMDVIKGGEPSSMGFLAIVIGIITSAIVGILAIAALRWFLKNDKFKVFAYYCLCLGGVVLFVSFMELLFNGSQPFFRF